MGLYHSFDNDGEFTFKFCLTDNIMDYSDIATQHKNILDYDNTRVNFKNNQIKIIRSDIQNYVNIPCQYCKTK